MSARSTFSDIKPTLVLLGIGVFFATVAVPALAQSPMLPQKLTPRPQTTSGVPHLQIGVAANPALSQSLLEQVAQLPGVRLGPTRVSLPGATGFQLIDGVKLARPEVIVGGREFAHLHPDGSLHASLEPQTAREAIARGWAVAHPWSQTRPGWEGFVMIYTPGNETELTTVVQLVKASYGFVTGRIVED